MQRELTIPSNDVFREIATKTEEEEMLAWLLERKDNPFLAAWHDFISTPSKRGFSRVRKGTRGGAEGNADEE